MGFNLFGSSSSSKQQTTNNSYDQSLTADMSAGMGATSSGNTSIGAGANYTVDGMNDTEATAFLNTVGAAFSEMLKSTSDLASSAISTTAGMNTGIASAYSDAYNTNKATFEVLKPYALYGLLGFVAYEFLKKKR